LDHESVSSQRNSADLITRHIEQICGDCKNVILMGDFNVTEDNETVEIIRRYGLKLKDTCTSQSYQQKERGTFHSFSGDKNGLKIDYIFAHPSMKVNEFSIIRDNVKNRYPSDHFPIMTKFELK